MDSLDIANRSFASAGYVISVEPLYLEDDMSKQQPPPSQGDLVHRGQKYSTPLGRTVFVGLRILDPVLQYALLGTGLGESLLRKTGLRALTDGPPSQTGTRAIDALGLSPYRLFLLALVAGGSAKQSYWVVTTGEEAFPVGVAVLVGVVQAVFSATNSFFAVSAISGGEPTGTTTTKARLALSGALFVAGIFLEIAPESYRKKFKSKPENRGKICTQGWWSVVRHPNYTGFILWRTGAGLAAGGWIGGLLFFIATFYTMSTGAVPSLDAYASRKYREQWEDYKKMTRYRLFPGIW